MRAQRHLPATSCFVDENGVWIGEPVLAANLKAYRGMLDSLPE